ncbi:hypothetical protein GW17_00030402, partial [Ensete ventricosum]
VCRRRVVLYRSVYTGSVANRYADQSLSGDTTKIDRRRSISTINDRLTEKSIVDDQLKKKKGKEEEEKKKEEEVHARALAAWVDRESSSPAGHPRDVIAVAARERLSSPRWERDRGDPAPALRHSRASLTFNNCLAQDTGGVCDFGGETGGDGSRRKRGTVGGIQITLPDSLFPVHMPSLFPVVASLLHGFPCRSFS